MKNRVFVIVVCAAFLASMVGMAYAQDETCEPMSQGFYKRVCEKEHPELAGFNDPLTLCGDLEAKTKGDPCLRAAAQDAALSYNIYYGILDLTCEVLDDDDNITDVEAVLAEIDALLAIGDDESCKEASSLAEGINSRDNLYTPDLFTMEQNTFYKDIYAKISSWLNGLLKSS